ncbi:hypothetical protein AQZ52_02300 [Novosphingobium fuchskuhlense]|uniref:Fe-S oxidoreductase n=1 Tax=Novosphingobium fuchskuhlense TaxID=1117702 RepID=A0A124JVC9_9SPHN|nr:DUF1289 domain-containing protein [Novosphingobium fuchskuhlense]KUR72152.1 hypothetical protein AQZ52_02300 [Novosphingobium fuchskuhlense]
MDHPPSPCTGTCTLDPFTKLCRGCARTIEEIMAWPSATAQAKHAILGAVSERLQSVSVRSK